MKPIAAIDGLLSRVGNSLPSLFRFFIGVILLQFALLSFFSVVLPESVTALHKLSTLVTSGNFWWGIFSAYGGLALLGEHHLHKSTGCISLGYSAALISFAALGYDFMLRKPPGYAGGIFAFTTAVVLAGVVYVRSRPTAQRI